MDDPHPILAVDIWVQCYSCDTGHDRDEFADDLYKVLGWHALTKNYDDMVTTFTTWSLRSDDPPTTRQRCRRGSG